MKEAEIIDDKTIKKDIAKLWNQAYIDYDDCYAHGLKSEKERLEWLKLLNILIKKKPSKILDVGAGTGFITMFLAELGHKCKGIDLSEKMLSVAESKASKAGYDNVTFTLGDAENTGEGSNQYDVVINRHLVWTLPHPHEAIKEWYRILKPDGELIIMEGNWHYNRFSDKTKVFVGKCLLSVQQGQSAFSHKGNYNKDVIEALPMMKSKNAKRLATLVKNAGFSVTVVKLTDIDKAEKEAMPYAYRLINPYKRIAVIGIKE